MRISTEKIAKEIRKKIIKMHMKGPNVGSALSAADILAVLYFDIMKIKSPADPDRDRFILSKGHAVSALYAVLSEKGFISDILLDEYLADGGVLYGHPVRGSIPGIEVTTGSLGHGLPIAIGMAIGAKSGHKKYRIFVLMGDGECQEGSIWEGAMLASRLQLSNITVIIDANNLQGYDRVENIQPVSTFAAKWRAFGWRVVETDGHNVDELRGVLQNVPFMKDKPSIVIAHTVKGKGISEMEDKLGWHYYSVPEDKVDSFISELEEGK